MEYKIKAIPTLYKGLTFRSRLEATWAAFFDNLGWTWRHEPFDLDGWVPDFEIETSIKERLLVEVKPINLTKINRNKIEETPYRKVINHLDNFNVLLLGVSPVVFEGKYCAGVFLEGDERGRCCEGYSEEHKYGVDFAAFKNAGRGLSPLYGSWQCWLSNSDYDKGFVWEDEKGDIEYLFNNAISKTTRGW